MSSIPLADLSAWLADQTRDAGEETVVLAGHFAIFSAGGVAVDLLDSTQPSPAAVAGMVEFTRTTWTAALRAAAAAGSFGSRLLVLVDDIQFIRPQIDDRSVAERLSAELATAYLRRHAQLPDYHQRLMNELGVSQDRVLTRADAQWMFSERELRREAVSALRVALRQREPSHHGVTVRDDGTRLTVAMHDVDEYCLIHSGHTTCAGGYLELLRQLNQRGVRRLVGLIPARCLGQVSTAVMLAKTMLGLGRMDITHVAIAEPGTSDLAAIVRSPAENRTGPGGVS